jgi:calcineurin-like phosphoesterase family protein
MSKIFLVGDIHLGLGWPNSHNKWSKVHQQYFSDFLYPLLDKNLEGGDVIVLLGDFFDNRDLIPIDTLHYGMSVIERLSQYAPVHLIVGNHDLWTRSHSEINSVMPFRWMPDVHVYSSTTRVKILGKSCVMMPYIHDKREQIKSIHEIGSGDYLFCHSDLNGCKMHLTSSAHRNPDKIDLEEFQKFGKVRSGHIHIRQEMGIFKFVGSIFQMDRADMGDQKGIWVIDTRDDTETFIPNNVSPQFQKVTVLTHEDVESLSQLNTQGNFIDLLISNKLLLEDRKIRRKLEVILEKSNFLSVSHINDVLESKKTTSNSSDTEEESVERRIDLELEFTDIIRDWIEQQNWQSNKIKGGILEEFEAISRIYQENYKG